ncbi:trehalase-like [Diachasmimorpha longicaudata]|uniref:trehalase-like n=1 Tax=Diachasmimorpha longicaudata TaxID=58733 RepID=UPI0030B90837
MAMRVLLFILVLSGVHGASIVTKYGETNIQRDLCDSEIYCQGELLKTVQLAGIFNDSKTFVDLYQIHDPAVTLANFEKMMQATGRKPSRAQVAQFVSNNFDNIDEALPWNPPDWQANPPILSRIQDLKFRNWIYQLNGIWKNLSRQMSNRVLQYPERHSFIPVEYGYIVPGGRFQEFYYWDSYWAVEGLLLCGMKDTVKGMLLNFLSIVQRFGFVPNGGRIYYLMRSHPPLLIPMVEKYLEATGDIDFLADNLLTLEEEFNYFHEQKTVDVARNGRTYRMARYIVSSEGPRPESYREDYHLGNLFPENKRKEFLEDLKAGAESGWDFSSRWFVTSGNKTGNLSDTSTRNVIPVDLNALLERNARLLAQFNKLLGNEVKAKKWLDIARTYQLGIDEVLWNEEAGIWLDYDLKNRRPRRFFYPSNLTPLYTKSFDSSKSDIYAKRTVEYLKAEGIGDFMGGTPSSLSITNEQWDAPNAWAPLQSFIVQGLYNTNAEPALEAAKELASRWLRANYLGFEEYGVMFEKYDAGNPGHYGGGGEYKVQPGFAFTNGVVFEFLDMYPDLTVSDTKYEGRSIFER